ncbi:hypothetical protein [Paenirhodobacter sp. CAU 1674]|uniref:hypothetical protein n=1 Tax=Paenirhodobacter sp. CAU 1674 TaxID=3032596 RepID=UPI0023DC9F0F|nr:hypothetical protein [Paenirhodobacter sp. CAU 1674]MDF2140840.1 hypothetical protein [Paenirhodobacter sp. CAU 1674]
MTKLPYRLSAAEMDILDERRGQRTREGFFHTHDDRHTGFQLSQAADEYLRAAVTCARHPEINPCNLRASGSWPWSARWWKPCAPRRMLVKAAALLIAEIERMDRAARGNGGAP